MRTTGGKHSHTTAMDVLVAKALNKYSDRVFIEALSERDCAAMSELVEEFFCSGHDEQEQGKQLYIKRNLRILLKCAMDRAGE